MKSVQYTNDIMQMRPSEVENSVIAVLKGEDSPSVIVVYACSEGDVEKELQTLMESIEAKLDTYDITAVDWKESTEFKSLIKEFTIEEITIAQTAEYREALLHSKLKEAARSGDPFQTIILWGAIMNHIGSYAAVNPWLDDREDPLELMRMFWDNINE